MYRRLTQLIAGIEGRQIAPAMSRVNAILDDIKSISGVARGAADGADAGLRQNRLSGTARSLTQAFPASKRSNAVARPSAIT